MCKTSHTVNDQDYTNAKTNESKSIKLTYRYPHGNEIISWAIYK